MLTTGDRVVLSRWCRARRVPGSTGSAKAGAPAVTLHAVPGRMLLRIMIEADGMRLETETGDTLAAASGLLALLDAVDAGIAMLPEIGGGRAQSSAAGLNMAGSAIT